MLLISPRHVTGFVKSLHPQSLGLLGGDEFTDKYTNNIYEWSHYDKEIITHICPMCDDKNLPNLPNVVKYLFLVSQTTFFHKNVRKSKS